MKLEEGTLLDNRYRIESLIGQGGMSYVYRAVDQRMGRNVAIKVLKEEYCEDEEFIRKFQNEAQAAARLNHPNVVAAYDVVDSDDNRTHYIVMELVEGITLKNYIHRKGLLTNRETIGIAMQVVDGIEQAHRMGIIHRDIKPQNMIIDAEGVVKVADFGIARAASSQTVNATVMGSVHYISPEQARSGIADERSDIYSFGCSMFEMLTGKVPFDGDNSVAVVLSHLESDTPHVRDLVPEVYPALDMVVYKCMQKKPALRYQHIGELGEDLRSALEDPSGRFIRQAEDPDELGETRVLSREELNSIQSGSRGSRENGLKRLIRRLLGGMPGNQGMDSQEVNAQVSHVYRLIAAACGVFILILLGILGKRLFTFLRAGTELSTTAAAATTESSSREELNITISALETKLPNIIGMRVEEATTYLENYNMHIRTSKEEFSDTYNEGLIISYPNERYEAGGSIPVTVSRGPATLTFYDRNNPEDLSALHATAFTDLEQQLKDRNIPYETESEYSDTVKKGNVISTNKPDSSGSTQLVITVSEGMSEDMVSVPRLTGITEQEAAAALTDASLLVGNITYIPSEDAPEGMVLSQTVEEGTLVMKGGYVGFTVSAGPNGEASVKAATQDSGESTEDAWYGSINESVMLGSEGGPGITDTMVVTIRLRQDYNGESYYTVLQRARSYSLGTDLQVVFAKIKGEPGVPTGTVEVVNAEEDSVIASYEVTFAP